MKLHKITFIILVVVGLLSSCQNFEELEKNPNNPTSVPASLIFNGVLNDMFSAYNRPWGDISRWEQYNAVNYNYYGSNEYAWTGASLNYFSLKNVVKMEQEAEKTFGKGKTNPYGALGKFLKSYLYYNMTMRVGDLPMMEAIKGLDNATPKYDTQKDIFKETIALLDKSNDEMAELITANDLSLTGDIYYGNSLKSWQKAVNTFKLRVLIQLSKKEADTDLNIKQKFSEVLSNPTKYPIMTGMSDNLQYIYNAALNKYPVSPDNFGFDATRYNMAATFIGLLTSFKDPRVYYVAEPAQKKVDAGTSPLSFDAFVGASSGEDLADMSTKALAGDYSFYNRYRYYRTYTAENTIIVGYPELNFNIAEAINRGWVAGNAEDFYKKGIQASIGFFGVKEGSNDVKFFKKGAAGVTNESNYDTYAVNFKFDDYYAQTSVKYVAGATGLNQILTQKYLGFFMNSGWEAYYTYRRTGIPTFSVGVGTGNSGRIPKRFRYPNSELNYNTNNYNEAVQRQFSTGGDDINNDIWINK